MSLTINITVPPPQPVTVLYQEAKNGADAPAGAIVSTVSGITGASAITNAVSITQADYAAISAPDASTLYILI